eukprot:GHVQ01022965.1.p1 GENE.GHVQ01022965.1~~GHVQ01022965.1.p1  ORF type:complete len:297 (+),score=15.55 GHVQ01022965.1:206-1096(+)
MKDKSEISFYISRFRAFTRRKRSWIMLLTPIILVSIGLVVFYFFRRSSTVQHITKLSMSVSNATASDTDADPGGSWELEELISDRFSVVTVLSPSLPEFRQETPAWQSFLGPLTELATEQIKLFVNSSCIVEVGTGFGVTTKQLELAGVNVFPYENQDFETFRRSQFTNKQLRQLKYGDAFEQHPACDVVMASSTSRVPISDLLMFFPGSKFIYFTSNPKELKLSVWPSDPALADVPNKDMFATAIRRLGYQIAAVSSWSWMWANSTFPDPEQPSIPSPVFSVAMGFYNNAKPLGR